MNKVLQSIRLFIDSGSQDSNAQAEFISLMCNQIALEFERPLKVYRIHTTDASTNVRFYIDSISPLKLHLEGYFGVNYDQDISMYCEILAFIDESRLLLEEHKIQGSVMKLEFTISNDNIVITKKWHSDSYGEWSANISPDWKKYRAPTRTFDELDPAPWHDKPFIQYPV